MTAPVAQRPAAGSAAAQEWALVERAQAGDADAFGLIYERYRQSVFRFVYFRCGRHPQLAEDLTGDTFVRALRRIGSVTWQGRDFGAWLITVARNLVADYYKSGRYQREFSVDSTALPHLPEDVRHVPARPEPYDPAEEAIASELQLVLRSALRQLGEYQRTCLELRFYSGLTVEETACKMGITEGACKALQYRAVRALARLPQIQALDPGLVPA